MLKLKALILILCWMSTPLSAGWVSGGGQLLGDANNPWFIRKPNTKKSVIKYCIQVDEQNFGVSKYDLSVQVDNAFRYWQYEEFPSAHIPTQNPTAIVGSEMFVESECTEDVVLKFQFGYLSNSQLQEFSKLNQDPRSFVGLAVRTHYNDRLQGKGFVYISPPRGDLAMRSREMVDDPWATDNQNRLTYVLRHELGHVFGLTHSGSHEDLMGAGFPDYMISRSLETPTPPTGIFRPTYGSFIFSNCNLNHMLREFFGIDGVCMRFSISANTIDVHQRMKFNDYRWRKVGSIALNKPRRVRFEPAIQIWLPESQTLFPKEVREKKPFITGPMIRHQQVTGVFVHDESAIRRRVYLHISPSETQIGGISDGVMIMDLMDM